MNENEKAKLSAPAAILYRFIYPACVYFSISIFVTTAVVYLAQSVSFAPTIKTQVFLWLFSAAMAALQNIFRLKAVNLFFRVLLHYIGTIALFVVVFIVLAGNQNNASGGFMLVILISVVYLPAAVIVMIIRAALNKAGNKEKKYNSQFNR